MAAVRWVNVIRGVPIGRVAPSVRAVRSRTTEGSAVPTITLPRLLTAIAASAACIVSATATPALAGHPAQPAVIEHHAEASDGRIGFDTPVIALAGPDGNGVLILSNRSPEVVAIALDVGAIDDQGRTVSGPAPVRLSTSEVHLGGFERARIQVNAADSPHQIATVTARPLVATSSAAVAQAIVLTSATPSENAAIVKARMRGSTIEVSLNATGESAAVVAGRVRVRSWIGSTVLEAAFPTTLVGAGKQRTVLLPLRMPLLPAPARVELLLEVQGTNIDPITSTVFLIAPAVARTLAALLLIAAAAALLLMRRRRIS